MGNGGEVVTIEEKPEEATSSLEWASAEATKKKEVVEISGDYKRSAFYVKQSI